MPSPTDVELRVQPSPVPTQIVFGLVGSIVMAPIDCTRCLSKTGLNVVPPSSDFQTPPDAAPAKTTVLPPSLRAATAATRPDIAAEPMLRMPRPLMTPASIVGGRAGSGGGADSAVCVVVGPATMRRATFSPWPG